MKRVRIPMIDDANMSDRNILVSVEDLIAIAFGPPKENRVDFKLIQTILHILARQVRLLEQDVEIKWDEFQNLPKVAVQESKTLSPKSRRKHKEIEDGHTPSKQTQSESPRDRHRKIHKGDDDEKTIKKSGTDSDNERKERKEGKRGRSDIEDEKRKPSQKEDSDKLSARGGTGEKDVISEKRVKDRGGIPKEDEKDRAAQVEKDRASSAAQGEKDKASSAAQGEKDKASNAAQGEKDKASSAAQGEKDRAGSAAAQGEKNRAGSAAQGEKDKAGGAAQGKKDKAGGATQSKKDRAGSAAQSKKDRAGGTEKSKKDKTDSVAQRGGDRASRAEKSGEDRGGNSTEGETGGKDRPVSVAQDAKEKASAAQGGKARASSPPQGGKDKADSDKGESKSRAGSAQGRKLDSKEIKHGEEGRDGEDHPDDKQGKATMERKQSSITIREKKKKGSDETVLVVEKGPTTRADAKRPKVGTIDVVTVSEFNQLEKLVNHLKSVAKPVRPTLPENKQLRKDIEKGTATLPDAMEAMQLSSRVTAAENAINVFSDLLTQLATWDGLPHDIAAQLHHIEDDMQALSPGSVRVKKPMKTLSTKSSKLSSSSRTSWTDPNSKDGCVTHIDLHNIVTDLKIDLINKANTIAQRAMNMAEQAMFMAKDLEEKVGIAMLLNQRISDLNSLTQDYAEQLNGFDQGLSTQMSSFNEQILQIKTDLDAGLTVLAQASNNESQVLIDLAERYEGLVNDIEATSHTHKALLVLNKEFGEELKELGETVEMLREQKADRDEVIDGLRDKADLSRLTGLVTDEAFAMTKEDLFQRLNLSYDKFNRQDEKWMEALKELMDLTGTKADYTAMMSLRDYSANQLRDIQEKLRQLYIMMGDPKAALLTRQLGQGAVCGACKDSALMPAVEPSAGAPPRLPALPPRPPPSAPPAPAPCLPTLVWGDTHDATCATRHICQRWVGGSHTLLTPENIIRERAAPLKVPLRPTRKYVGYAGDGKLCKLEEDLYPCEECNQPPDVLASGDTPCEDPDVLRTCPCEVVEGQAETKEKVESILKIETKGEKHVLV